MSFIKDLVLFLGNLLYRNLNLKTRCIAARQAVGNLCCACHYLFEFVVDYRVTSNKPASKRIVTYNIILKIYEDYTGRCSKCQYNEAIDEEFKKTMQTITCTNGSQF